LSTSFRYLTSSEDTTFHDGYIMIDSQPRIKTLWKSIIDDYEPFIFGIALFLASGPYFLWHIDMPAYPILICFILLIRNLSNRYSNFVFFFVFIVIYSYVGIRLDPAFFKLVLTVGISLLFLTKDSFIYRCFDNFKYIYSVALIPSIIMYILVNGIEINLSFNLFEPLNHLKTFKYHQYPFLVQTPKVLEILPRFHAYFDEPGVVGTFSGIFLIASTNKLKSWINIPIIISGVLSFSLVFYLIIFVFAGYNIIVSKLKNKLPLFFIVSLGIPFLIYNMTVKSYIYSRLFGASISNAIKRTSSSYALWYEDFSSTAGYYFGLGNRSSLIHNLGGSVYKDIIVDYGVIFFTIYLVSLALYAVEKINLRRELILYFFIMVIILYQRPYITSLPYMFMLISPVLYIKEESKAKNELHNTAF
jgi:hypothetical protein